MAKRPTPTSQATSVEDAVKQSTTWFGGDTLAAEVFVHKYALTDPETGLCLEPTPDLMHRRLAREFARIEAKYPNPLSEDEIYGYLEGFKRIIPQGSPMSAIGNPYRVESISNCFVIPVGDSYGWICQADQQLAQIYKRRGGCGLDISAIRPKNFATKNAARTSDGIAGFMERFSNTTREVAQNSRRGANMQTISVHHPEVLTFIKIKRDKKKVTGSNISVRLTDEFMRAVVEDRDYEQRFPVEGTPVFSQMVSAKEVWNEIIYSAWFSAEPGLLFWDRVQNYSPVASYGLKWRNSSTNPCSELPLANYDACRLLLVNLTGFVQGRFTPEARFDHQEFGRVVQVAQRLMDDIVDLELEAIDKILAKVDSDPEPDAVKEVERSLWTKVREKCSDGRRTGLGITGLGDTIAYLGVKYGSQESINLTEEIYKTLCYNSYLSSHILAAERGSFPDFDSEKEQGNEFLEHLWAEFPDLRDLNTTHGRRNIANLTTAPAGSASLVAQTSSGIESVFRLEYLRRKKEGNDVLDVDFVDANGDRWKNYAVYHHGLQSWKDVTGETDITKSPYWGATSEAISWESSVELQGAAQRWIDHAISKTCNLPETATQEDVASVYLAAWKAGCKGFTVYRDKCRDGVLVTEDEKKVEAIPFSDHHAPKRPVELPCEIHQVQVQGEKWTVFVGLLDGKPYEVIGGLATLVKIPRKVKQGRIVKHNGPAHPKARYDLHYGEDLDDETVIQDIAGIWENPTHAAFTRTISLALRHGTPVQYVVEQLVKGSEKEDDMFSFSRCVSRVLKGYIHDGTSTKKTCPTCKNQDLVYQEGCVSCPGCGWSKCS